MSSNSENINTAAQGIKRASGDQGSAEVFGVQDQIAADRYAQSNKRRAKRSPFGRGMRYKQRPPGAGGT